MRKKIVLFLAIIVIAWGINVGIKSVSFENDELIENDKQNEVSNEIYVDELNLPLIEVDTLNPLKTKNNQVASILRLVYEPLIDYDSDESLEFILLKEYAKLDSKTWIFKVKSDVLWHEGKSFNADDVIFTFNKLIDNDLTYSSNLENVKEITKLDEYSLKVSLENDDDYFISKLNFPIVPEYYFKDNGFDDEYKINKPVGTGAYKYSNIDSEGNILLEFNSSWHMSDNAKLKKINLYKYATYGEAVKAFKSAEIDMIVTNMSDWEDKFGTIGLNSYSFENSEFEVIIPNCNNIALSENSVRRAILHAINRENIINSVYYDNASVSDIPVHTNSKNSITNAEYDLEKAKQILINAAWVQDESGWKKVINGKKYNLSFNLLVNSENEKKVEVAEKIKSDLSEIGIIININKVSKDKINSAIQNDNFELILTSFDIKSEFFIQEQLEKNAVKNYSNYSSDSMQKVIDDMAVSFESYDNNMYLFTQIYKNDAPYIGLYFRTSTILTNKSVKGNFEPTWSNYYRNMTSFCK